MPDATAHLNVLGSVEGAAAGFVLIDFSEEEAVLLEQLLVLIRPRIRGTSVELIGTDQQSVAENCRVSHAGRFQAVPSVCFIAVDGSRGMDEDAFAAQP